MAAKKRNIDEDKIAVWESLIDSSRASIKDMAARIAGGFVDLESSEFIAILECLELNRRQITAFRSLIEEEKSK